MAKKYIAIYLRLSLEDDVEERSSRDESDSITSQREIVLRYIQEHEELQQYSIMEFIDDGYSGTNFDRPNIQKLLNLVREGKIQIIIVKDLSRFGRNYLEVGDYLEHLFPYLNVRFIAVNDHYDSNAYNRLTPFERASRFWNSQMMRCEHICMTPLIWLLFMPTLK